MYECLPLSVIIQLHLLVWHDRMIADIAHYATHLVFLFRYIAYIRCFLSGNMRHRSQQHEEESSLCYDEFRQKDAASDDE